jgi:hypothetical protein
VAEQQHKPARILHRTPQASPTTANLPVAVLPDMSKRRQKLSSDQNQMALTKLEYAYDEYLL